MIDDLRYAARSLWKTKGFTAIAILCLALGIGGTTAIFSVVKTVLWSPLPYPDAGRIALVRQEGGHWPLPLADLIMAEQRSFTEIGALRPMSYNVSKGDDIVEVPGAQITPGLLPTLGLDPLAGRAFEPRDDRADAERVAMLSEPASERFFADPAAALGSTLWLNGLAYTVVGVLPREFDGIVGDYEVFVTPGPFRDEFPLNHIGAQRFQIAGRLAADASVASAAAEMDLMPARIQEQWRGQFGPNQRFALEVKPLEDVLTEDSRSLVWLLMGAVVSVLLIACANVANLLLTRATVRARETAVRQALGATAGSLVRQHLAEGLVLAVLGAVGGLLVAAWGVHLVGSEAVDVIPMITRVEIDLAVLVFTLGVAVASAVAFSLVPAMSSIRQELTRPLQAGGLGWRPRGRRLTQGWIVAAEIALALLLVVGAGLSLRSVQHLSGFDLGFQPEGAVVADFELPANRYPDNEQRTAFGRELVEWVQGQPGVTSAALSDQVPLMPASGRNTDPMTRDLTGTPMNDLPRSASVIAASLRVGPAAIETLGVELQRGRGFAEDDFARGRVVLLDHVLARSLFGDEDPVGEQVRSFAGIATVIGIVAPVRNQDVFRDVHVGVAVYPTHTPWNRSGAGLIVRTEGDEMDLAAEVRAKAFELDPELPAFTVEPYDDAVSGRIAQQGLLLDLLGLFAIVAAVMAGVGIYGLMSYSVTQRTHEIGIRNALGAPDGLLIALVMGDGLRPVFAGLAVGLLGAGLASRLLESLIFGVEPLDPLAFAAAVIGILLVAAAASFVPVRRAVRLPPMSALRQE